MKNVLVRSLGALGLVAAASVATAADVGVSISVSQPGVYGRIDIGRYPQPVLIQSQPVIIQRGPRMVEPVYLWVPPGHQKNWRKHCGRYNACGVPVYFVQDGWYHQNVMAGPRGDWDDDRKPGKGHGKGHKDHKDKEHRGRDRDRD